jgi:hypothetical protein
VSEVELEFGGPYRDARGNWRVQIGPSVFQFHADSALEAITRLLGVLLREGEFAPPEEPPTALAEARRRWPERARREAAWVERQPTSEGVPAPEWEEPPTGEAKPLCPFCEEPEASAATIARLTAALREVVEVAHEATQADARALEWARRQAPEVLRRAAAALGEEEG